MRLYLPPLSPPSVPNAFPDSLLHFLSTFPANFTSVMLQISSIPQFKSLALTSQFLHGSPSSTATVHFSRPTPSAATVPPPPSSLVIKAMKSLQGRVVCSTNDKTVAVEVTRLAPHPKYKRRIRKKKTYQAHDPTNQFKVGDYVQLEKTRPISKNKTFLATPAPERRNRKADASAEPPQELGIPLESAS